MTLNEFDRVYQNARLNAGRDGEFTVVGVENGSPRVAYDVVVLTFEEFDRLVSLARTAVEEVTK